jgi:hypothetical protein
MDIQFAGSWSGRRWKDVNESVFGKFWFRGLLGRPRWGLMVMFRENHLSAVVSANYISALYRLD